MNIITQLHELQKNIFTLDNYLERKTEPTYDFACSLIMKGTCFAVVKKGYRFRFYPSRFIGYTKNTMDKHLNNEEKDGRITNPAISLILNYKPIPNVFIDQQYMKYCEYLGFAARDKGSFGVILKYWNLN